ncbi:hypothetical protein QYE76_009518 [Lolium multiflorum]|uniref:F-box domain-containing protein n=1 Tax=Lolium multiflorum TaxID=4521 RepID=A0AAD8X1B4_LOLMU|nr:hypothetical protein QYE76_009518 [Lolium multiflorum]
MEHGRQRCDRERDCISDLPDDLLHGILSHLRSFPAAVRTSALSRRWRRVWASLPDLVLPNDLNHDGASSFLDIVDDALAAYNTDPSVHLRRLEISVPYECDNVPARRLSAWLRFASRRLLGELDLLVPIGLLSAHKPPPGEIELPPLERATSMSLVLGHRFLIRPPPVGVFAALVEMDIRLATMDARALEVLVSSQCPRLQNLSLLFFRLVNDSDVSISSASLRRLRFYDRETRRVNVAAPNLQELRVSLLGEVHVAAPNLAELASYNIGQFVFAEAVRNLRLLEAADWSAMATLMRQFDTVDELRLHADVKEDEFVRFMDDTTNLLKCDTLSVSLRSRCSSGLGRQRRRRRAPPLPAQPATSPALPANGDRRHGPPLPAQPATPSALAADDGDAPLLSRRGLLLLRLWPPMSMEILVGSICSWLSSNNVSPTIPAVADQFHHRTLRQPPHNPLCAD